MTEKKGENVISVKTSNVRLNSCGAAVVFVQADSGLLRVVRAAAGCNTLSRFSDFIIWKWRRFFVGNRPAIIKCLHNDQQPDRRSSYLSYTNQPSLFHFLYKTLIFSPQK